jgi:hypothetical protein
VSLVAHLPLRAWDKVASSVRVSTRFLASVTGKLTIAMIGVVTIFGLWFQTWSLDGLQGALLGLLLHRQDTAYAVGYSDRAFRSVKHGMSEGQVHALLGPPIGVTWSYRVTQSPSCESVHFRGGRAQSLVYSIACEKLGVRQGVLLKDAVALLPEPDDIYWIYSESPSDTHFRKRVIHFSQGRVVEVVSGWHLD